MPCSCRGSGHQCERCRIGNNIRAGRYRKTEKYRATVRRYRQSPKGKATRLRKNHTPERREYNRFWIRSRRSHLRILENKL